MSLYQSNQDVGARAITMKDQDTEIPFAVVGALDGF